MEDKKLELIKLIDTSSKNEKLKDVFKDESFQLQSFESSKEEILDTLESRLSINRLGGNLVYGLEETITNIKVYAPERVVTNLMNKDNWDVIIYTDPSYVIIFGLI